MEHVALRWKDAVGSAEPRARFHEPLPVNGLSGRFKRSPKAAMLAQLEDLRIVRRVDGEHYGLAGW